ncbi:hypothetical protein MYRNA_90 [Mycobacterium phage Myrna]|uniref:Uncharacterized protein n=1 Tax=Mycobacterium phage Myrna TaxID=546805 RepID=B5LJ94_9CAUD|nr:gp90 [Mycobacterium phage Myrna]ACH62091.1 hypothetical protein MYRNA_90 [Mycobacterium phage Myrna]
MPTPYEKPAPEMHENTEMEFGIRLPNGEEVWPPELYMGKIQYQESAERAIIMSAIADGIRNMGLPFDETLAQFQWLTRYKRTITLTSYLDRVDENPIDHPAMTEQSRYSETGTQDPE